MLDFLKKKKEKAYLSADGHTIDQFLKLAHANGDNISDCDSPHPMPNKKYLEDYLRTVPEVFGAFRIVDTMCIFRFYRSHRTEGEYESAFGNPLGYDASAKYIK